MKCWFPCPALGEDPVKADFFSAPRLIHSEETLLFRTSAGFVQQRYRSSLSSGIRIIMKRCWRLWRSRRRLYGTGKYFDSDENVIRRLWHRKLKSEKAMQRRKVWMANNGSYLVIDETEALTVIDVNTGKYIGEKTIFRKRSSRPTSRRPKRSPAAPPAGYRRDRGYRLHRHGERRKQAESGGRLEEALKQDRTKTNVLGSPSWALVEMTRKRCGASCPPFCRRPAPTARARENSIQMPPWPCGCGGGQPGRCITMRRAI